MQLNSKKQYTVDGVNLLDLVNKYSAPLYVYTTAKMEAQYKRLTNAFKDTALRINYACKALTNINILKFFNSLGSGLDTVSIQEVELGLKVGFKPENIIYTPNCVAFSEIEKAVQLGVQVNIDNIPILEKFGHKFGASYPICIRINPNILAGGNQKISTGHIDSKFGISIHQMRHVQRIIAAENIIVEGLHMHTGSDILDVDVFLQGADIMFELAYSFKNLRYIDFGSGFKVAYKPDDVTTDIEMLGEKMGRKFSDFCQEYGKDLTLMFEPGKFLVSESGYFLTKVNVVKTTTATVFAGIDSGLNHFIRPMFYDGYHYITNISNPSGQPRIYTVAGYICETDTFAWDRKINEIHEGDVLAFHNAGAYGFMMSSNYNSRFRPAEILIHNGKDYLIRKRECLDDLLRNQVVVEYLERCF